MKTIVIYKCKSLYVEKVDSIGKKTVWIPKLPEKHYLLTIMLYVVLISNNEISKDLVLLDI